MSKKEWLNPELKNLGVNDTNEGVCFCTQNEEAASSEVYLLDENGTRRRPGHGHNPNKPHKPCPPTPTPNPDPDVDPS